MLVPKFARKLLLQMFHTRKTTPIRKRVSLLNRQLEELEDRSVPASFTGITPDNGVSSTDYITNTGAITVSGTWHNANGGSPANGTSVTITDVGNGSFSTTVQNGQWALDLTSTPLSSGTHTLTYSDGQGTATQNVVIDTQAPSINSVSAPANATYKTGDNLDFVVTFSEAVAVTGTPALSLTVGSTARTADYLSGSGTAQLTFRYTVPAGDSDTDGIAVSSPITLPSGATIKDIAGNATSLTFTPPTTTGVLVDGIPPTVTSTNPSLTGGTLVGGATSLQVNFSENVVGAATASNYELRSQGADGLLGNADDTIVTVSPSYNGTTSTLNFSALADGVYRLTVKNTISDIAGNALVPFTRDFVVGANSYSLTSPNGFTFDPEFGGFGAGQLVQGTGNAFDGLNRLQVGGADYVPAFNTTPRSAAAVGGSTLTITLSDTEVVRLGAAAQVNNSGGSPHLGTANFDVDGKGAGGRTVFIDAGTNDLSFESAVTLGPGTHTITAGVSTVGYNILSLSALAFTPVPTPILDDGGRTVLTPQQTLSGLQVSREVTVPATGSEDFARTVDVYTNPTASDITTTVTVVGNLGTDAATTIFGTSDGDTNFTTADHWVGTDDADGSGSPAVIHYIHGPAGLVPASAQVVGDNIIWTYNLTVPAGQTVRLASFTITETTRAQAIAAANALVTSSGFGGQAAAFLTAGELASLANFQFDRPPVAVPGGPYTYEYTGGAYSLNASGSSDPDGDPITLYEWDLNADGTYEASSASPTLSFNFGVGVGTYPLRLRVTAGGLTATADTTLKLQDTTSPTFSNVPSNQTVEATSPNGAAVTWTPPTATDLADPNPTVISNHSPGETFPLGTTTVTYTATDASGNQRTASFTVKVQDTTPPDTTLTGNPTSPTNNPTPTFTFSGSDVASVVASFEVSVDSGTFTAASGNSFTTGTLADGSHTFEVRAIDNAGNVDPTPASYPFTVDTTPPAVQSITRAASNPTSAASVDYTVTFTEDVSGVDASDFALTTTGVSGASITGVSGSGSTYTVTVSTGTGDGTIRLDLADDDSIADAATNPLGGAGTQNFTSGEVYTIDKTAPTVQSITRVDPDPTNSTSVTYTVAFSENVSGVDTSNFALTTTGVAGASITGVSGSGSSYTITVNTGTGDGTIRLDLVADGSITDDATNALTQSFTSGEVYTVDKTVPTVSSITRAGSNPTSAASVDYTVAFSESVSGVDAGDFALASSGLSNVSITGVSGSGSSYTVTVSTGSGFGTLGLNLVDDDSIADAAGNPLGGTGTGNGNFTGEVYDVDHVGPTTSGVTITPDPANIAPTVNATVSDASTGNNGVQATEFFIDSVGSDGTGLTSIDAATFSGLSEGTHTVYFHGQDNLGNWGATAQATFVKDTIAPTIAISVPSATSTLTGPITYTITYADTNFDLSTLTAASITLNATGTATGTIGVSGTGASRTVTISNITGAGTLGISIAAGTASDLAGNLAAAAGPSTTFVVGLGLGGQLDFQPSAASPLQAGSVAVLPGTSYTAARGYGWTKTPGRTNDAGALASLSGNPLAYQLRDYMSDFGGLSSAGIFRFDLSSTNPVQITAFLGDASTNLDGIEVAYSTNGVNFTPYTPGGGLSIAAGKFTSVTSGAISPILSGGIAPLWIRFQDSGGSTSNWSAAGFSIRPVASVTQLGAPELAAKSADGMTPDWFTVSGAAPGAVLTISASLGTILTDARPELLGNQVIADGTGTAQFQVRRPFVDGTSTITVADFTGASTTTFTQDYTLVTARKFDMNASTPSLPDASWIDVRTTSLYTPTAGYGWTSAPSATDTATNYPAGSTAAQQALYRDYHSGMGTNTFRAYVGFGPRTVKLYTYAPGSAGMTVSLEGGAFQPVSGSSTTFNTTVGADGILDITFRSGSFFSYWAVNAIEVL